VGLQLLAPAREDARLYEVGAGIEALVTNANGAPVWAGVPTEYAAPAASTTTSA
jgi:aspartyl-tRNA(Asn)/glutamyl-tRNA(Gln) amidotransferase subunit A